MDDEFEVGGKYRVLSGNFVDVTYEEQRAAPLVVGEEFTVEAIDGDDVSIAIDMSKGLLPTKPNRYVISAHAIHKCENIS